MQTDATQVKSWINGAPPHDLVDISKAFGERVSSLDLTTRQQIVQNLPSRLFEGIPEFGKQTA